MKNLNIFKDLFLKCEFFMKNSYNTQYNKNLERRAIMEKDSKKYV